MQASNKYEVLEGLPPYGPMYVPVSENNEQFYSEGFVVRFTKSDGTDWIGNFKTGRTNYSTVFELPVIGQIVVIACGQGYIMTTDQQTPVNTFGHGITELVETSTGGYVAANETNLVMINADGSIWESERISWDGIKDLVLNGNIISGLSYDPMNNADEWVPFYFNTDTKLIEKGSYKRYYNDDGTNKKETILKILVIRFISISLI